MRKNIERVVEAFRQGQTASDKSCSTNGKELFSYAMRIAWRDVRGRVQCVSYADAPTKTTRDHVRAVRAAFGLAASEEAEKREQKARVSKATWRKIQEAGRVIEHYGQGIEVAAGVLGEDTEEAVLRYVDQVTEQIYVLRALLKQ